MIIVKTPLRISLFGGGTDYPEHFSKHGGAVLGMAVDKYVWTTVRYLPPFFSYRHRLAYSHIETVDTAEELRHPVARCLLKGYTKGLEIHHDADLPARSGMGSSSSFTVGLINALAALNGGVSTKKSLAESAIKVERELIGESGGWQDQIWAAYGGFNRIDFHPDSTWTVRPMVLPLERIRELYSSIALYFTGLSRFSSDVAGPQISRTAVNQDRLVLMQEFVDAATEALQNRKSLAVLGELLQQSWELKRQLSEDVSAAWIDELVERGLKAGAWGAKLLGAGGGGFLLFLVPPGRRAALREAMGSRIEISVQPDYDGSRVVLYQPNGL